MRLERLSIRGVLRFESTLDLDLRDLPSGLVAIVGENGSGKTTTLESPIAALYRQFPSRADRELVDYAHDRDGFLEAQFALDGRGLFRARVNVDGVKRSSDAILEQLLPDGRRQVLNDGKVTTYDQAIAQIFPSRELLQASAFAAQNRAGSFVTLDRKGRKNLFAKLLGLDHYERMSETARTAAGLVEAARGRLVAVRDLLARDVTPAIEDGLDQEAYALTGEHQRTAATRADLQAAIARLEADLAGLQEQTTRYHAAVARRDASRDGVARAEALAAKYRQDIGDETSQRAAEVDAFDARIAGALAAIDRALVDGTALAGELIAIEADLGRELMRLATETGDPAPLAADLARVEASLCTQLADIDKRLANNRALVADADAIRKAARAHEETLTAQARWQIQQQDVRNEIAALEARREDTRTSLHALDLVQADLSRLEDAVQTLAGVPCEGGGAFGACRFLTSAKAAEQRLPGLRAQVIGRDALERTLAEQTASIGRLDAKSQDIARQIKILEQQAAAAGQKAKLLSNIGAAETRIAELEGFRGDAEQVAAQQRNEAQAREETRQASLRVQGDQARSRAAGASEAARTREHVRLGELATRRAQTERDADAQRRSAQERHEQRLVSLRAHAEEQDGLVVHLQDDLQAASYEAQDTAAAALRARQLDAELTSARQRWDESTAQFARAQAAIGDVARRRDAFEAKRLELTDVETRIRCLEAELLDWQLLARALGRDGLPVLEIDGAGPTVSSYTNDLLTTCFGPRFSVELVTQEAKVSGRGMKESFELKVYDSQRGGEPRDISDLSGGEQIIVDEALKNAIAILVNTRSAIKIRTCFRDETTSPLDGENAIRYLAMLRRVHEIAGFVHTLFVTHNDTAAQQADAQIWCHDGTAEILLPPYDQRRAA